MRAQFYKILTKVCSLFGSIGTKLQSWAEFKEWEYWNDGQSQNIDLPGDRMVTIRYDRKGSFTDVFFWKWVTDSKGKRDLEYIRETIHLVR